MATACLKYIVFICKNENYPYKNFIISQRYILSKCGYTVKSLLNKSLGEWLFLHKIKG